MSDEEDSTPDLPLFARTSDPSTSHESMAKMDRARVQGAALVMVQILQDNGPLADFEQRPLFEAALGRPGGHLYRQARSVARDQGLVRKTEHEKFNPATKRYQIVWEACNEPPPTILKCPTCGHVLSREDGIH